MEGDTRNGNDRTTLTEAGFCDKPEAGKSPHRSSGNGVAFCFFWTHTISFNVAKRSVV